MSTKIEWTDEVWNPVTGCTKVSSGCANCYAERFAARGMGPWKGREFTDVQCHEDRLSIPLRMKKPRRVFINSMSDLLHERVPFEFIDKVFAVVALTPHITYQLLTKRPERLLEYVPGCIERNRSRLFDPECIMPGCRLPVQAADWPPKNLWLGVSIENQATADQRIPLLLQTPAAKRFVSAEPLLGPVDLHRLALWSDSITAMGVPAPPNFRGVDWVIVGGESGPGARPFNIDWARSLRDQCKAAGVPYFLKQLGSNAILDTTCHHCETRATADGFERYLRHPKGADPAEWPPDLQGCREVPS